MTALLRRNSHSEHQDNVAVSCVGDVIFLVWNAPVRAVRMRWALDRRVKRWMTDIEGTVVIVNVILSTSSPPDRAAYAEATAALGRSTGKVRRFISVAVGDTFWLRLVRTVIRTMAIAVNQAGGFAICASLDEALKLVARHAGDRPPGEADLRRALAAIGAALGTTL